MVTFIVHVISKLQQEVDKENCKVIELSDQLLKYNWSCDLLMFEMLLHCSKELECSKLEQRTQEQLKEKETIHNKASQQAQQKIKLLQNKLDHVSKRWCHLCHILILLVQSKRVRVKGSVKSHRTWSAGPCENTWWEGLLCRSHALKFTAIAKKFNISTTGEN